MASNHAEHEVVGRLLHEEVVVLFLALGALLLVARVLGELARALGQPTVLGELLAGVLLGPTVLGRLWPQLVTWLFPAQGGTALAMNGILSVAIALFLLVAGMEVDLSSVWRQGRAALTVGLAGIAFPFTVGAVTAAIAPDAIGREAGASTLVFSLFLGTALSISALPVIAKTLMDLNLYRSDLGMLVIAAAVLNDLAGWLIFALILGMMHQSGTHSLPLAYTVFLTLLFAAGVLTVGRWAINKSLPWIQAHTAWPGGVLSISLALGLLSAGATEWIGVHAVFGAFLIGVAVGDSAHLREQTRTIMHQFISFIFAPLFFASIGLSVDFFANFDPLLCLLVVVIACIGKIFGCSWGARLGGIGLRESWAVGFAMNARGAMEIILGLLALQYGIIRERMFVALVVMALFTSLLSGPALRKILRLRNPRRLDNFVSGKAFIADMTATTATEAIVVLSKLASAAGGLDENAVQAAVLEREAQGATGIGESVAVPHARLDSIRQPVVAVGLSSEGVDFDAPDGAPANLVFLLLTPRDDDGAQLEILADIARKFSDDAFRGRAVSVKGFTEFLALLRTFPDRTHG